MSLYSELKRRNVFRVALLYLVSSWVVLQVADVGVSLLGLPDWTGRFIFLLLVIGFPLVIVFSWIYEITPDGIKRETEVEVDASIAADTARKLNTAVIVMLVVALGGLLADRLIPRTSGKLSQTASAPENSIAVLPFVNMSPDSDNEYFSDGLSEELLNLLAKTPELLVAARTSAFSFKGSNADIQQIAARLNVAYVLEGSVRKSGDSIRVTTQLIQASDGYHLWSESWDRKLTDVFVIQDDIAAAVVAELKVTLLGELPRAPVADTRAYDLYLRAKSVANNATNSALAEAVLLLNEAVTIDPQFAAGWAELGTAQVNQVVQGFVPQVTGVQRAGASYAKALEVDPQYVQALGGLSWIAMFYEWDFGEAARLLSRAADINPRNVKVLNSSAALAAVFGQFSEAISLQETALELDPLALSVLHNLSIAYSNNGRLDDSFVALEAMRAIAPDSMLVTIDEAWLTWYAGETLQALELFTRLPGPSGHWGRVFALHDLGRREEAEGALKMLADSGGRAMQVASAYAYLGDKDKAFAEFDRAFANRDGWLIEIRGFKFLESLHADPRWAHLLKKIGISDEDAQRIGIGEF